MRGFTLPEAKSIIILIARYYSGEIYYRYAACFAGSLMTDESNTKTVDVIAFQIGNNLT